MKSGLRGFMPPPVVVFAWAVLLVYTAPGMTIPLNSRPAGISAPPPPVYAWLIRAEATPTVPGAGAFTA